MKALLIVLAVIAAAAVAGYALYASYQPLSPQPPPSISGNVVEITPSGFSPSTLTINAGESVSFVNIDAASHWPASAPHPVHTDYPGFDALRGLSQGEAFTFTFNQAGEWKYHDHLNPVAPFFGAIIVLETEQPAESSVEVVGYPSSINANSTFYINWKVNSDRTINIQHTAVHYGPQTVPNPKEPSDYPSASAIQSGTIPKSFSAGLSIPVPATYYFRAHAIVEGENIWSDEKTIIVAAPPAPPAPATSYIIEADDSGFYFPNGTSVSSISAAANSSMTLTFETRTQNVYFGGLDYRSQKFNSPKVAPGENWTSPSFTVGGSFPIISYWPSSGVSKAILNIVAV